MKNQKRVFLSLKVFKLLNVEDLTFKMHGQADLLWRVIFSVKPKNLLFYLPLQQSNYFLFFLIRNSYISIDFSSIETL
jgi:hypothetical protein